MSKVIYANVPQRVKAAFIDSAVLVGMLYGFSELFSLFEHIPDFVRIITFVFVFFLYDPLLVSIYGETMGHSFVGIQVKKTSNTTANISFPTALLRFILKSTLGWISLLTATGTEKNQAIHDFAAGSVVMENLKTK